MRRRNFVKSLLSLTGGGLLPGFLQAKTTTNDTSNSVLFKSLGVAFPEKRNITLNIIGVGINAGHILQDLYQSGLNDIEYTFIDSHFDGRNVQTLWIESNKSKPHIGTFRHHNEADDIDDVIYKRSDFKAAHSMVDRNIKTNKDTITIIIADTSDQAVRLFLPYLVKASSNNSHATLAITLVPDHLLHLHEDSERYSKAINLASFVERWSDLSMMLISDVQRQKKGNYFLNKWNCNEYGAKGYSIRSMVNIIYSLLQPQGFPMPGVDFSDLRYLFFGIPMKPPIEFEVHINGELLSSTLDLMMKMNDKNKTNKFNKRVFINVTANKDDLFDYWKIIEKLGLNFHPDCMNQCMFINDSSEEVKGKVRITILHA